MDVAHKQLPCEAYFVSCIPNTSPARGLLHFAPYGFTPDPQHICTTNRRSGIEKRARLLGRLNSPQSGHTSPGVACTCPTTSLLRRHGEGVSDLAMCEGHRRYPVFQCSNTPLLPPALGRHASLEHRRSLQRRSRSHADVLLVTSDNRGHGLFATVERVLNQLLYARAAGLEPYVYIGEFIFSEGTGCEHGRQPYYDAARGDNVWDYFFYQPSSYRLGQASVGSRPVRSVQTMHPQTLYTLKLPAHFTQTYSGDAAYKADSMGLYRRAAHSVLGNGSMVRAEILSRAERIFRPWRVASSHILGVHMRGTDKVVTKKVPPEAYFPLIDCWLRAHNDARVFIATDDRAHYRRLVARYGLAVEGVGLGGRATLLSGTRGGARAHVSRGVVLVHTAGYESANVIADRRLSAFQKGLEVLLDALLLSKCDFLLKTTSAVAEFAIWLNFGLHDRHIDLQWEDRFRSQRLPAWASSVGERDAQRYCDALARGCAREAKLLQHGQQCARCMPAVSTMDTSAASRASGVPDGTVCEASSTKRLLSQPECVAYAHAQGADFLGVQRELGEFPGCIHWTTGMVEYNDHTEQRSGCNLGAKGRCICTSAL